MDRQRWRGQVIEEALESDIPIIDAHHHLWSKSPAEPFEAYDYKALLADKTGSGHNIVATVYIDAHSNYRTDGPEAMRVVGETEHADWVTEEGNRLGGRAAGICAAIVPHADLLLGSRVGEVLDGHGSASQRFRGIRHMTAFDPDLQPIYGATERGIMARPEFREGMGELRNRGLSFDAWLLQPQLPELVDLARACPDNLIILDHLAGPLAIGRYAGRRAEAFAAWRSGMAELATCPNVAVKIGALNMAHTGMAPVGADRPNGSEAMARVQRDHILTTIELFGPNRCMFESNFPVDMLYTSYTVLWNAFKRVTHGFSPAERTDLFAETARRTYRIA